MSVLDEILKRKRAEVEARRREEPEGDLGRRLDAAPPARDFQAHLRAPCPAASGLRIIAEFKRASPSRGPIRPGADPAEIARAYEAAGAVGLSVLTDGPSFDGSLEDLESAQAAVRLPVLRKDFIVHHTQILEARAAGADSVLLIAAALTDRDLAQFRDIAFNLGMEPLVEVHDRSEMERVLKLDFRLVGINNRDLRTLEVSLETTRRLIDQRPKEALIVSESGFSRREEMEEMRGWGADAFLVGESLMSAADPGEALRALTGGAAGGRRPGERPRVRVKICGITREEDARLALDAGAWAIGFVFHPPSPRYIAPGDAALLLRRLPPETLAVGVFVDAPLDEVNGTVEAVGLRGVQLHGVEGPEYAARVRAERVIKAFRVGPGFDPARIGDYPRQEVLLDAYREGLPGGTGRTFDWGVAREVGRRRPVLLSGGLTPENVEAAIAQARPAGIDLSSGAESRPGRKDPEKIRRLFEAVRRAAAQPEPRTLNPEP